MKNTKMAVWVLIGLFGIISLISLKLVSVRAQKSEGAAQYQALKAQAEKLFAEKSYALAREQYVKVNLAELPPAEARWVQFRLADTLWRSEAATETSDSTQFDQARHQLEVLVRDIQRPEDRDLVWAEVQESLGDFWWLRRQSRNWWQGWQYYQQALGYWANSVNLDQARDRYLAIVFRMTGPPPWADQYYRYGNYGSIPQDVVANAHKIAKTPNDRAHTAYLMAVSFRYYGGQWEDRERVPSYFEEALKAGKQTEWYDDALFEYAQWMENTGNISWSAETGWKQTPDYLKALDLYRRVTTEFKKGDTRYFDQATESIKNITRPVIGVSVSNVFLPDSLVDYSLNWRNVKRIELALYPVDLTQDIRFGQNESSIGNWLQTVNLAGKSTVKTWAKDTGDKGDHRPQYESLRLDDPLAVGAYVLEASAGDLKVRELVLVTNAALVVKSAPSKLVALMTDAGSGAPLAGAKLKVFEQYYQNSTWKIREHALTTNENGLAETQTFPAESTQHYFWVSGQHQGHQAICSTDQYTSRYGNQWKVYAFTDRPAYRPGESVQWKFVVRSKDDQTWTTPANQMVEFEITDPRGTKVKEDKVKLNEFGSAWGSLDVTESMPLGEYRIQFWTQGRSQNIGAAQLFRLEEYKLPEFKVSVTTPEENGRKKAFKLGETVEVAVQADYYFGGPVANATVQVVVYQNPYYQSWQPPRDYPWFYQETDQREYRGYGNNGQVIKQETLKTDLNGKAVLTFETPRTGQVDFEYRVEARVTDASRREIIGSDSVRVTRQRYYVYLQPDHTIYHPQDRVKIKIKALDANRNPVQTDGTILVSREKWHEIWLDPTGREVTGDELKQLQASPKGFPPQLKPGECGWQMKSRGYKREEVLKQIVKTDAEGNGELTFVAAQEGYYSANWTSVDQDQRPIFGSTAFWVSTTGTADLGFRPTEVKIVIDQDTAVVGQTMPVLITSPYTDRYVLFSVEGEELYSHQLVHLTSNTKLVEVPIDSRHIPNVFFRAVMVSNYQVMGDSVEVIVPPTRNFLSVEVKADREEYQSRQDGQLTVTTRDAANKPVSAEVSLGLVDESVFYIQQEYAGDPRSFFFGQKQRLLVRFNHSFAYKPYLRKLLKEKETVGLDRVGDKGDTEVSQRRDEAKGERQRIAYLQAGVSADSNAVPAPASAPAELDDLKLMKEQSAEKRAAPAKKTTLAATGGEEPAVVVRNDFRAVAFWQPDIRTDAQGKAVVKVKYPDTLTSWKAVARAFTTGAQTGIGETATRTKQPLIVRLQAPRFFVERDQTTVSAVINNNTRQEMMITPMLAADGLVVTGSLASGRLVKGEPGPIKVPANGEARVDWVVSVVKAGTARLKVTATGGQYSDAMERDYPVFEHGIEKLIAKSGKMRGDSVAIQLELPAERKPETTNLTVQVTPSMAVTMLDALPYLANYPYGCTEQTMSRFLPAVITAQTLSNLGLKPESVMGKMFGGIEPQFAAKTHTKAPEDLRKLNDMTTAGLKRLYDFQHGDGGWGWWKDGDSDHFMTAYVLWGLSLARDARVQVDETVLARAARYLDQEIVEEELNFDAQAWMLHALAVYSAPVQKFNAESPNGKAYLNLWKNRDRLNAYTMSLLALAAHHFRRTEDARILSQNLENGVKLDTKPDTSVLERGAKASDPSVMGTAHWGADGLYWRWSDSPVETTAFALRALVAIDPTHKLIEPVTNWLIKNRRGAQWSNTRDTAIAVLALNDYLRTTKELSANVTYELHVNGKLMAAKTVTPEDALNAPSQFPINAALIRNGANDIQIIRKGGTAPLYFAAQATFFSTEEPITPAGNELFVNREYYRLVAQPTLLSGYRYERVRLADGDTLTSGDRVEVVLTIETKNDYEYLLFEDLKPAGLEAVQLRSGESLYAQELRADAIKPELRGKSPDQTRLGGSNYDYTGKQQWIYQELRDRKVALFASKLGQGVWQIKYDLRAEVPGTFHALPLMGHAMYVPEIRANGAEMRLKVVDK